MTIIKIVVFTVVLIVGLVFFALYRNGANLFEEPGFNERLAVFLTTNSAQTADDHVFSELRTPVYDIDAETLYQSVLQAAVELGWEIHSHDRDNQNTNFVVYSPVFLFKDDVYVQVNYVDKNRSSLFIRSSSQVGRADFAANSGHIQELLKKLSH